MSYSYGEYKDKDGNVALLQSDALSRGKYERKGLTYVGPAETVPGLEENPDWVEATKKGEDSTETILRKMAGTFTEEEAAAERAVIRGEMEDRGAFDYLKANLPEAEEAAAKPAKTTHATTTTADNAAGAPGTSTAPRAKASTS
jgi:hypothetical protein